jgi:2-hydroxy-3-keto-5-methylthiopentenyl-1-phosphate phosphatase
MIQIDLMEVLLKRLKNSGWKQNGGYAIKGNPRVLERYGKKIAVVKPIKIDPFKVLQDEIDKFFRSLIDIINKNGIKNVFLPGGGTIPIPQFFLDFCKENGINIHVVTNENIDQFGDLEE